MYKYKTVYSKTFELCLCFYLKFLMKFSFADVLCFKYHWIYLNKKFSPLNLG